MKQFFYFNIVFLLLATYGYSQTIELGVESGIATFNMSDLKKLNETQQEKLPFRAEITYNFPAYIYYKPMALVNFNRFSFGMSVSFQSTGSRLSRQDYSGEYIFDMLVRSCSLGIEGAAVLVKKNNHTIQLALSAGAIFSQFNVKDNITLFDSVLTKNNGDYDGKNIFITPSIRYSYTIKSIKFGTNIGYLVQLWDNPFYVPNTENKLTIKPDWSGLRAGLFVSYLFNNE